MLVTQTDNTLLFSSTRSLGYLRSVYELKDHYSYIITVYSEDTLCVGIARIGSDDQMIVAGKMKELKDMDFGEPLHSFIVTGDCHVCELETLAYYATEQGCSRPWLEP